MRELTIDALNPAIRNVQYAVRGELAIKAEHYRERLQTGDHDLPFNKVISSNIGNPQQSGLDQAPITFNRQVGVLLGRLEQLLRRHARSDDFACGWGFFFCVCVRYFCKKKKQVAALMEWPALAELAKDAFPADVIARAQELLSEIGSIGAYSHSQGVPFIRRNVAKFIEG
jgi:alanine transaminase